MALSSNGYSAFSARVCLVGVSALALAASVAGSARAETDAETKAEIRALREELHRLEPLREHLRRLERRLNEETQARRSGKPAGGQAQPAVAVSKDGPGAGKDGPTVVGSKFIYRGVTITPGGFVSLNETYRNHNMSSDLVTTFSNIPYANNPASHTDELRSSVRQSRPTLTVDADVGEGAHATGYGEFDFLGAPQTANANNANSYVPRIRHLYGEVGWNDLGVRLMAGQAWSLATLSARGITPLGVASPPVIDGNLMVGFVYTRQPQLRLVKEFGDFAIALSAENSESTFAFPGPGIAGTTTALPFVPGFNGSPLLFGAPIAGGLFNPSVNYSFNRMPDFVGKAAWDPMIGDRRIHVEAYGLAREFTDRVYWSNDRVWGGGVGGGIVVPVVPQLLDVQASALIGSGIGRYGPSLISDATYSLTGAPQTIRERIFNAGATLHLTPRTDIYAFAGGEFTSPSAQYAALGRTLSIGGWGNQFYDNAGCNIENGPWAPAIGDTNCAGQSQVKAVRQLTAGVWHSFYKGGYGEVKGGLQYSYTIKDALPGFGPTPRATENTIYTTLRYYPF